jgi:hypothetical protein
MSPCSPSLRLSSDLPVLALTLTVSVPIVTTMTSAMPPARVAAIRITTAVHPVAIATLAAVRPVAVVVLSGGVAYSQATETENHQRTEHYRSLNLHIAPSSGPPLILTGRLSNGGFPAA